MLSYTVEDLTATVTCDDKNAELVWVEDALGLSDRTEQAVDLWEETTLDEFKAGRDFTFTTTDELSDFLEVLDEFASPR